MMVDCLLVGQEGEHVDAKEADEEAEDEGPDNEAWVPGRGRGVLEEDVTKGWSPVP